MNKIKIDCKALKEWIKNQDMTSSEMSYKLGRSKSYLSNIACEYVEYMSKPQYDLFLKTFNLPDGSFIAPKTGMMKQPDTDIRTPKVVPNGYWLNLKYSATAVKVQLMFGDEVVMGGISKIKGKTMLDFAQAVSYASHMVYKFIEQKELQGKVEG